MRQPTQATPHSRASSIAVSAARATTRWPMPLSPSTSAVAGAVRVHLDVGARIGRAEFEPLHVLRQAEHAVRIGAGEIGLQHQLGDLGGVGRRHAGFRHGVDDQAGDGRNRNAAGLGCGLHVHGYFPANKASALPPRMAALSASEIFKRADVRDAIEHRHVVGIIAAEQHVVAADQADHHFQRFAGMQDGVVQDSARRCSWAAP